MIITENIRVIKKLQSCPVRMIITDNIRVTKNPEVGNQVSNSNINTNSGYEGCKKYS